MEISGSMAAALVGGGVLAGVANAVAGGGTLFTFPMLLAAGLPPVVANASNAVAVWPGHAFAAWGLRPELARLAVRRGRLALLAVLAVLGGAVGAALVRWTGDAAFRLLAPPLLLAATLVFAFGPRLAEAARRFSHPDGAAWPAAVFGLAVYGGFFGAGLGVMLMAALLVLGVRDPHGNNALKNLLATFVTTSGVVVFAVSGLVAWGPAALVLAGCTGGALAGARLARRLPAAGLRRVIVAAGLALAAWYAARIYGPLAG